jgi:O-antigen/teichoic acid export membrane protein
MEPSLLDCALNRRRLTHSFRLQALTIQPDRGSITMTFSIAFLLRGTAWTIGAFGVSQVLRLVTNIILTRLLAPDIFGTMLIIYSLATGLELISDVGIGQNIVHNKNAENPDFYNTAWSLQLIRSVVLWLVFLAAAAPMARFYESPILAHIVPFTAFSIVILGLSSVSKAMLQKRLQIVKLTVYETFMALISSTAVILLAYFNPTIWALVFANLFSSTASMIGSHLLLSDIKQRFNLSKQFVWQILGFGKWIFISSIVYFLSTYIDRLYLAKVVPLELLGIYGIARSLSDISINLVLRLGSVVVFPFIASHSHLPRADLREKLASIRTRFLLLAALGFSFFIATADLAIKILYDERYHAATWILPVLIIGSWLSTLATLNESTLLGLGKPSYSAISNGLKLAFLLIGLLLSTKIYGLLGGVVIVALAEVCRYFPVLVGQIRERFSFGMQDFFVTLALFSLVGLWEWLRWLAGFGTSFDSLPI